MDATIVDTRFVARKLASSDGSGGSFEVREYMIDVPGPSGTEPVRLTFTEQSSRVRGNPKRGDVVPVAVNRRRTKAMFDFSDPRIDGHGWVTEQSRMYKEREDARFEARRAKREVVPDPEDEFS